MWSPGTATQIVTGKNQQFQDGFQQMFEWLTDRRRDIQVAAVKIQEFFVGVSEAGEWRTIGWHMSCINSEIINKNFDALCCIDLMFLGFTTCEEGLEKCRPPDPLCCTAWLSDSEVLAFQWIKKNYQNSSNFTMSRWLFSWCHSEPPHVWHCCWESWLKLNYGPQGKVWTQLKMPLKISFSVITYAIHLFSATFLLLTHTVSEHTHILITENLYCFP